MIYRLLIVIIIGIILASCNQVSSGLQPENTENSVNSGAIVLDSSKTRINNREEFFNKEYSIIEKYRNNHSSVKKQRTSSLNQIVGLSLSGGGIKSSAFQLGLLSGLNGSSNTKNAPLLGEIDYISSVSGGSWANGAYMSAPESDDEFFSCLSSIAAMEKSSTCSDLSSVLANVQDSIKGSGNWHQQITGNYLRENDITFRSMREQMHTHPNRPFPIFLATHSNTMIEKKSLKNFPFEFTPVSISAIADCNTPETPCGFFRQYLRPLHWNNPPEKGFVIEFSEGNRISTTVDKYGIYDEANELQLSHAMWASGGLVAKVFSLHLHLRTEEQKIHGIREKYVLSDGGKTDNVGLIPLVERGTDLIILSQIVSDAKLEFGDLKRSSMQVEKLFDLNVDTEKLIQPHHNGEKEHPIITQSYIKDGENNISSIWLIKPTPNNMTGFYGFLKKSKYAKLHDYLTEEKQMDPEDPVRFPQTNTIKFKYHKKLIYSYYALGEYIGKEELAEALNHWLENES